MPKKQPQKSRRPKSKKRVTAPAQGGSASGGKQTKQPKAHKESGKPEIRVLNDHGKTVETVPIDDIIATSETKSHLLYQAAVAAQANNRVGTVMTKNRSEVSGGGKKPWKQKGTGRARHGSIRSPLWRHGGTTFGPRPRDYGYELPRRMKTLALIAGLKVKAVEGKLFMIEEFASKDGKTKGMASLAAKLSLKKPIVITDHHDPMTLRATRNLKNVHLTTSDQVAPYDVLVSDECLLTKKGYSKLIDRLKARQS